MVLAMPRNKHGKTPELNLNRVLRTVTIDGNEIQLTFKEFEILNFLSTHPYEVFSRYEIMENIWKDRSTLDASRVCVHVTRLRKKIQGDPYQPQFIKTIWGVGYYFDPEG